MKLRNGTFPWSDKLLGLLIVACVASSVVVVRDFAPLAGSGDTQIWEYTGYYVGTNLEFGLFPRLSLENDQLFYPYGTSNVFQPWGFERDYFYAASHLLFGPGPWLPVYYVLSVLITGVGAYALSCRDLGAPRAFIIGFAPAVMNFHGIAKYPFQFGYAIIHWSVLSFVADFLIVRRVVCRQPVGARLLLGRLLLVVLSLGQDLTYAASYGLVSLAVSGAVVACVLAVRSWENRLGRFDSLSRRLRRAQHELRSSPLLTVGLLSAIVLATWLYTPLVLQVASKAMRFDFGNSTGGDWWVSPVRLLIPFFPGLHPLSPGIDGAFGDAPGGAAPEGSPGWFLVSLAALGLWQSRRHLLVFMPVGIVFAICVLYLPPTLPTLKVFPWFEFFRVGGRSTSFYPVILGLLASGIRWEALSLRRHRIMGTALTGLCVVEIYVAYRVILDFPRHHTDAKAFDYFKHIQRQSGEALLDWPFCAIGGNGVGSALCANDPRALGVFTLQRFHGKKVVGGYFGRLHPRQVEAYLSDGWPRLIAKASSSGTRYGPCMEPADWRFFADFFEQNDFAGINLWVDLLAEPCAAEFHARFGEPARSTYVDGIGRAEFFPKPPRLGRRVDLDQQP